MRIERDIEIDRPIGEVFEFVADARNDPLWCPKVVSVEQVEGSAPGPGSRYAVVHKPVPLRPERRLTHSCVEWSPPHRIEWLEDDGTDRFEVEYTLEEVDGRTRMRQRSDAELGVHRLLHPVWRNGIRRDIAAQLRALKGVLEKR